MGAYKLNIGNATNWLKWTGSELQIKGRLSVGANTNEDIFFEDSGIRLYDYGNRMLKFYKAGYSVFSIYLSDYLRLESSTHFELVTSNKAFMLYSTGTLQLPQLEIAPTAHVADLTYHIDEGNNPYFHGYIGPPDNTWGRMSLDAPNW